MAFWQLSRDNPGFASPRSGQDLQHHDDACMFLVLATWLKITNGITSICPDHFHEIELDKLDFRPLQEYRCIRN